MLYVHCVFVLCSAPLCPHKWSQVICTPLGPTKYAVSCTAESVGLHLDQSEAPADPLLSGYQNTTPIGPTHSN